MTDAILKKFGLGSSSEIPHITMEKQKQAMRLPGKPLLSLDLHAGACRVGERSYFLYVRDTKGFVLILSQERQETRKPLEKV